MRPYFVLELTPRCNLDCTYCYNVWKQRDQPGGELSGREIVDLVRDRILAARPAGVTLSGGEPLLHPDVCEIASFLSRNHVPTGVATNGILLGEATARDLHAAGVRYFEISLASTDPDTWGRLAGDDRLSLVRRAILNVKRLRARLTVSFVATRLNVPDVEDVIELAYAFSADAVALNRFVPGGRGLDHREDLELSGDDLRAVLALADAKGRALGIPVNVTIPVEPCLVDHADHPHLAFGGCACGAAKWVVDPLGNLRTCEQNPAVLGSLLDTDFHALASQPEAEAFRADHLTPDCPDCAHLPRCGGGCRFLPGRRLGPRPLADETGTMPGEGP